MFVYNLKINKKKFVRIFSTFIVLMAILILALSLFKIFRNSSDVKETNSNVMNITSNDFTNFLKDCHLNIDKYVGTDVYIIGYVYRMPDFSDDEFVLARTMLMNSNNKAVIVGLLCKSPEVKKFKDTTWVSCKGTIEKGNYHGDMPVLNVQEIDECSVPEDDFVYSPQD